MKIIVDTNIIFSALISPDGVISDLIFNSHEFDFFSPESIEDELKRHEKKLAYYSKLKTNQLDKLYNSLIKKIEIIDLPTISNQSWVKAMELVKNVDEFDTPFVALAIELEGILWTGDKKLLNGLAQTPFDSFTDTSALIERRNKLDM